MKKISNLILATASLLATMACSEPENELTTGSTATLTSQEEVNLFVATGDLLQLTIRGASITDLSTLNVQKVKNIIIENTGIEHLRMPRLNAVTVMMHIKGNPKLASLDGLGNLKFINGSLIIEDNPALTDISGLLGLKVFSGSLSITGNAQFGKNEECLTSRPGFCPVKVLAESGVFSGRATFASNHPEAPTSIPTIGQVPGETIISYTLLSKNDVDNFSPLSDTVLNLTITGQEINSPLLNAVAAKITHVQGTVLIENTAIVTTEGFFDQIVCEGSIILRNNPDLSNPNGFKDYSHIGGDLIIEDCPDLALWASPNGTAGFSGVERIDGDFIVNPAIEVTDGGASFAKLAHVGGDFVLIGRSDAGKIWNLETWYVWGGGIKHIGGDLVIRDHFTLNGLSGLQALEHIGGDVYILDNGAGNSQEIPLMSSGSWIGFCIIKTLMNNGVLKKANPTIQLRTKPGAAFIDISTLPACE